MWFSARHYDVRKAESLTRNRGPMSDVSRGVTSCLPECVSVTSGLPQVAANLLQRHSRPPWAQKQAYAFGVRSNVCSLGKCLGVRALPPTFIYFVALPVWMTLACLVWLLAGVMALNRGTRRKGWSLALAMAATFPSVFLFQAVAAPLIAAMIVGLAWVSAILDPASTTHATSNGLVVAMAIGTALLAFVTMLAHHHWIL
jgi:hypothetical protein